MKTYILHLFLALVAVFAPAKGMILSAAMLITIDLVTGLMAAKKQNVPITSSGLRRTIVKLLVYEAAIMLAFITQQYLMPEIPVANIASGFVGVTELTSCLENINIIGGGDLLKNLVNKLGSDNKEKK